MDNCTYTCQWRGEYGHVVFKYYPFHEGKFSTCYRGRYLPSKHIGPAKVTVRVARHGSYSQEAVTVIVQGCHQAKAYFDHFLEQCKIAKYHIHFEVVFDLPIATSLKSVATAWNCFCGLLKGNDTELKEDEWVLIEEHLVGKRRTFVDNEGRSTCHDGDGVLAAFCHYTLCVSRYRLVVCGLKGVNSGHTFQLSLPCIHSMEKKFGETDQGEKGIKNFQKNHRCNVLCIDLLQWGELRSEPTVAQRRKKKRMSAQKSVFVSAQVPVPGR